jgi:hypothetical protein
MLGGAVRGHSAQLILRDVARQIGGDLSDRPFLRGLRGGLQHEGDLLMLFEPHRLQWAKDALLVDGLQVL